MKLTHFPAPDSSQKGVLILPGGGYYAHALDHEGEQIGQWLNARGFDAWMCEYTTASVCAPPLGAKPLADAVTAVERIRADFDLEKLGVWGFSAGGHLAATLATHSAIVLDFAVLAYPVISMADDFTHGGSRANLLGENPDEKLSFNLSAQNRVCAQTPPTFLFHTANDAGVPALGSLVFAQKLAQFGVPFELHIYEDGQHGVGLALENRKLKSWSESLEIWLRQR